LSRSSASSPSRRRFLALLGGAGAIGAAAFAVVTRDDGEPRATPLASSTPEADEASDVRVLNFALTLEHVAAAFYADVLDSGVIADRTVAELAKAFGQAELQHAETLAAAVKSLGGTPVVKPATRFADTIARGPDAVLMTAATIENLGAAAYLGQVASIKSREVLATALSIHSVEARHAAALNDLGGRGFGGSGGLEGSLPDGAFGKPLGSAAVRQALAPYIAG
jgi:rubrerythrin